MKSVRNYVLFALIVLLAALPACSAKPKGELLVYVAAPLSGFQANGGQTVLGGVRLMADQINKSGGLLGYSVKVVGEDDESDSDVAVSVAQAIRDDIKSGKKVLGIIGHYNSGQTLAAMEIYKDLPVIVVTPTSSEVSITQKGYRNFFRVNANDAVQAKIDAEFLVQTLGAKRVAVIHNDTAYGTGLRDQITKELARLGAQVAITLQVKEGQDSYAKETPQIAAAQPDAIFYAGYEIETPYLRADLVSAGVKAPMLASDGAFLAATIDEAEGKAEGLYVSSFAPSPASVADTQWMKAYRQVEFRNPDTYSINGYSAMAVLAEGVKRAKSLDTTKISQAIHSLQMTTLIGQISYDDKGDLKDPRIYIFQVRNSAFVQVYPK
jgi:branched-chain amino acid transport system substrate-binding protein